MTDQTPDLLSGAGKILDTEPVKNLLSPATRELGLVLGDFAGILRFYVRDNLEKVFAKWAALREGRPVTLGPELSRTLPLLQHASLAGDDELQERWALLLESASESIPEYLPSFGDTLAQLTADEARFLDRLYAHATRRTIGEEVRDLGPRGVLMQIYDPRLHPISYAEAQKLRAEIDRAELVIDDLERLRLITFRNASDGIKLGGTDAKSVMKYVEAIERAQRGGKGTYHFSEYGLAFVRTVGKDSPSDETSG